MNISEVFNFKSIKYQLDDNNIDFAVIKNNKLWILTQRTRSIVKVDLRTDKPNEIDDSSLMRKPIEKMFVDPKGLHCFFLAKHELYYNHFDSDKVIYISTNTQPANLKSIEIAYFSEGEDDIIEVFLGTDRGQIFHACLQYNPNGTIEALD